MSTREYVGLPAQVSRPYQNFHRSSCRWNHHSSSAIRPARNKFCSILRNSPRMLRRERTPDTLQKMFARVSSCAGQSTSSAMQTTGLHYLGPCTSDLVFQPHRPESCVASLQSVPQTSCTMLTRWSNGAATLPSGYTMTTKLATTSF